MNVRVNGLYVVQLARVCLPTPSESPLGVRSVLLSAKFRLALLEAVWQAQQRLAYQFGDAHALTARC